MDESESSGQAGAFQGKDRYQVFISLKSGIHKLNQNSMKKASKQLLLVLSLLLIMVMLEGCKLFSLHPLYTPADVVWVPEILGKWSGDDDGNYIQIVREENKAYRFTQVDGEDTVHYLMHLTSLAGHLFMDLYPYEYCSTMPGSAVQNDCSKSENILKNFIPVHSFSKVEINRGKLVITEFDVDRLKSLFRQNRIRLGHEKLDEEDLIILTASTSDLRKFIGKYAGDPKAFTSPVELSKFY